MHTVLVAQEDHDKRVAAGALGTQLHSLFEWHPDAHPAGRRRVNHDLCHKDGAWKMHGKGQNAARKIYAGEHCRPAPRWLDNIHAAHERSPSCFVNFDGSGKRR
eukprot:5883411-Prymnesium_polylepis.1